MDFCNDMLIGFSIPLAVTGFGWIGVRIYQYKHRNDPVYCNHCEYRYVQAPAGPGQWGGWTENEFCGANPKKTNTPHSITREYTEIKAEKNANNLCRDYRPHESSH